MADFELHDDILGTFPLDISNGVLVEEFEPGVPEVRKSVTDRPDYHGHRDTTMFYGGRVVSMRGKIRANERFTRLEIIDRLQRYLMPNKRPAIRWTRDGQTRQIVGRQENATMKYMIAADDFQVQWRTEPFWTSLTQKEYIVPYSAGVAPSGDPWPWLGVGDEIDFVDSQMGSQGIVNDGAAPTLPIVTIFGPVTGAAVANASTGLEFKFEPDLVIPVGQVVTVDFDAHTAVMNNDTNVFPFIDFQSTTWWAVEPGSNTLLLESDGTPAEQPWALVSFVERFV